MFSKADNSDRWVFKEAGYNRDHAILQKRLCEEISENPQEGCVKRLHFEV